MAIQDESALNVSEQAKQEGLTVPVTIAPSLAKQLQPNPYLASLGITLEQRITNLLQLVHAQMKTSVHDEPTEVRSTVPFMLVQGPFVREVALSILVIGETETDGHLSITLTQARDKDWLE
ncbi:hypothetical protein Holit_03137 [Hollandina sp. SP2]